MFCFWTAPINKWTAGTPANEERRKNHERALAKTITAAGAPANQPSRRKQQRKSRRSFDYISRGAGVPLRPTRFPTAADSLLLFT